MNEDLIKRCNNKVRQMSKINEQYEECEETLKAKADRQMILKQKEAFLKLLDALFLSVYKSKVEAAYRALVCGRDEKEAMKQFYAETKDVRHKIADNMMSTIKDYEESWNRLEEEVKTFVNANVHYAAKEILKTEWIVDMFMKYLVNKEY